LRCLIAIAAGVVRGGSWGPSRREGLISFRDEVTISIGGLRGWGSRVFEFIEKYSAWLAAIPAVLAIGGAYETFTGLSLFPRLIVAAIALLLICLGLNRVLAPRVKPPAQRNAPPPRFSWKWLSVSVAVHAVICLLGFFFVSALLIGRLTFQLDEMTTKGQAIARLVAPYPGVASVTIELPSYDDGRCDWRDLTPKSIPKLQSLIQDWNSPTPVLQIDGFKYPQRIAVICNGGEAIHNLSVEPVSTAIYLTDQLWWLRVWSAITGVGIWAIASASLLRLRR
jgi:hypothetical protein